jgi:peroxiredoxin
VQHELERAGGTILAISTDSPQACRAWNGAKGLGFPLLSDPMAQVTRRYDLLHEGGGPDDQDIAVPALILLARDGSIAWQRRSERVQDRASPDEVLAAVRALGPR